MGNKNSIALYDEIKEGRREREGVDLEATEDPGGSTCHLLDQGFTNVHIPARLGNEAMSFEYIKSGTGTVSRPEGCLVESPCYEGRVRGCD